MAAWGAWAVRHHFGLGHLFAYQLAYGVIPRLGWSSAEDAAICHQCDFAGCTNSAHMRLVLNTRNRIEYVTRRKNPAGPLADVRGAAGQTRAIAAAIRTGLANNENAASIEKPIRAENLALVASEIFNNRRIALGYIAFQIYRGGYGESAGQASEVQSRSQS